MNGYYTQSRYHIFKYRLSVRGESKKVQKERWQRKTEFNTFHGEFIAFMLKEDWDVLHAKHHMSGNSLDVYAYYDKLLYDKHRIIIIKDGETWYVILSMVMSAEIVRWVKENNPEFVKQVITLNLCA